MAHDKGDRPSSLKGRRPVITSLEMFLWRNYLIFTSCTAPPSFVTGDSSALDSSVRSQSQLSARDLFHKVSQFMPWSDRLHLTFFPHPLCALYMYVCSSLSTVQLMQEKAWEQRLHCKILCPLCAGGASVAYRWRDTRGGHHSSGPCQPSCLWVCHCMH